MAEDQLTYPEKVDLSNCDKEPIHIIGKIQSHGAIVVCDPERLMITQCTENTSELFQTAPENLLGQSLRILVGAEVEELLNDKLTRQDTLLPEEVMIGDRKFLMIPHFSEGHLLLDFEPHKQEDPARLQRQLTKILNNLQSAGTVEDLCKKAAGLTNDLFGYDRVLVYRFDEEWNGEVVAEEKQEDAESWLGLRYPASDIPAQSRALFLKNKVRIITDVNAVAAPLIPQLSPVTRKPLDLSKSGLRAVSPIHIEYLQNMGVGASLTAAIVVDGKLWGLITCHHNSARFLDYYQRESCRFLTQIFSNEIALRESNSFIEKRKIADRYREQLIHQMEQEKNLVSALTAHESKFTHLVSCGGGALMLGREIILSGKTPSEEEVRELVSSFLSRQEDNLFHTSNLSKVFTEAKKYRETASGILSIRISENTYLIWFRPEVVQTVNWGGNPGKKATYNEEKQRLSPRKSFEKWSQRLTGISENWEKSEIEIIRAFRENVSYRILENQKSEIESLNSELMKANEELELFSYGLSHDLKAPLRGITGYLQILKEDFGEKLDEEGHVFLNTTLELSEKMKLLIDGILSYSRLNSGKVEKSPFSVNELIEEILQVFNVPSNYPDTGILIQKNMPEMYGDRHMFFQLWANLINNALIYSSKKEKPQVEIGCTAKNGKTVYFIKDNGVGIPPEFQEKIFNTFSRLGGEEFKGSGIGLAIVKLVLEKHSGEIWIESRPGKGAAFYFFV